ncbi:MAG: lysine--tRNA ligase, partial [archaeon]
MNEEKLRKLQELKKKGIPSYPYRYAVTATSKEILDKYAHIVVAEHTQDIHSIAGRIVQMREMGKASFMHLQDSVGKIQVYLRADQLANYDLLKLLDLGDIIGVEGEVFRTKMGEITINARTVVLLTKSLGDLPEKYHGLKDIELRYRNRHLDLIANPEIRETFRKRAAIISTMRKVLDEKGFLEVETPVIQPIYGGGAAKPFTTFINDLKQNAYLRISDELYLKRLIVGGIDRVYEISKDFRNESIDRSHNPEFTMMEAYQAYADLHDMMDLCEEIFEQACLAVNGTLDVTYGEHKINFKRPWKRVRMIDCIKEHAGIDVTSMDEEALLSFIRTQHIKFDREEKKGYMVAAIFEHFCEEKLIQPTFIIDHP